MIDTLNKLIDEAPEENKGAASVQILVSGQVLAGAISRSSKEGLYEMVTAGQDPTTRQPMPIRVYIKADSIDAIFTPMDEIPKIFRPKNSGLIVPRS